MQVQTIPLDRLSVSKANMRCGRKAPDVSDILPSIVRHGVLSPLFVRAEAGGKVEDEPTRFEIVAGKRRYFASIEAMRQGSVIEGLPCIVITEGDDADALEISMIENLLRQNPDPVTQWESFTRLVKEGRDIDHIAAMFALAPLEVKRVLALGNLLPRIREACRAEEIDATTVRHLTLASKAQQKAWLALFDDPDAYAPRGSQLKAWLFGGGAISVKAALFDVTQYHGQIVADLFAEDGYFADTDAFWQAQLGEVEHRKARYLEQGWSHVEVIGPERHFASWEYEKTPKRKGGRVYVELRHSGEAIFHEGYLTHKEARHRQRQGTDGEAEAEAPAQGQRPELSANLTAYCDLHRHAVVRNELAGHPGKALRVMAAHAICGSPLWSVKTRQTPARCDAVNASVAASLAETHFAKRRNDMLALLDFDPDCTTIVDGGNFSALAPVYGKLRAMTDERVMSVLAMVMAESLWAGSELIEVLGEELGIDMADHWRADPCLVDLLRDREVLLAVLANVAGEATASAHAAEKGKVIKTVITDCLAGENGRSKAERWVPRWMKFPPSAYTARGGVATVDAAERVKWLIEEETPSADDKAEPDDDTPPWEVERTGNEAAGSEAVPLAA